ncbi:MAG: acyl-CoA dehydrogenase family protein [Pseudomonadales bacterium]|nr:acyl-CoA dehydrogenase family protein [Pseudomonadales bacterium]MDP6470072.1 acyl-CoA dehydrogenase family protein [Pseudomonadales bacterium]MDP6826975.1 acyl-CoA dehydrogenase family protein [Pseudomonadales bacterium]MDP6971070.1 acyl-CoA dehydrogenase family protein [Pseudomonadales bacterium]
MADLETFRKEVRVWLDANCPESMRTPTPENEVVWGGRQEQFTNPDSRVWLERMAERGYTVPGWPKVYGGAGLSADEERILQQEMGSIKARTPLNSFGIWMLGPALMEFASEEQKLEHLPKIARGEVRWCQGYSEPGYGSDLAGLQTKAEDRGDHYEVSGSKIWTSYADEADWIFCLVRTDTDAPKHEGISFLLFDMASDGVTTSPIELISGASPFCQTFFDSVKVPKHQLVGELNKGWTIAKRLLQHERNMVAGIGGNSAFGGSGRKIQDITKQYAGEQDGQVADSTLRGIITDHTVNDRAFQLTLARAGEEAKAGNSNGHLASMFKYYGTEQNKRKYELMLEIMGNRALGWEGKIFEDKELFTTRSWLRSKANSIEGGTSEVQLNVIAKRVLALPD